MSDEAWPPTLDVELDERQDAIMRCYELMERLVEEYGGRGCIRQVDAERIEVVLEYDLPVEEAEGDG